MWERADAFWRKQIENMACFAAYRHTLNGKQDVGLVRGAQAAAAHDHVWLLGMWVCPTVRGQNLGERLAQAVIGWAGQFESVSRVKLEVNSRNRPAILLYERLGFHKVNQDTLDARAPVESVEYDYLIRTLTPP